MAFEWTAKFLEELAKSPNVSGACRAAGISRVAAYDHKRTDPAFAAAWDDALEQSTDDLVGEAYRRAKEGCEKAVYYQGVECGRVVEYSDTLAIFLLKAHRRSVYGDKVEQQQDGKVEVIIRHADDVHGDAPPPAPGATEDSL